MYLKNSDNVGRLEVICGSMFSGKSEELIRRLRRVTYTRQNIVVFKHSIDKRYGETGVFSHNKDSIEAYPASSIEDMEKILNERPDTEVIGIDEVQFFGSDVVKFCKKYVDLGKRVVVAGLDLDFKAEPFHPMPELMCIADSVDKLKAICMVCGKEAHSSQRLINGEPAFRDDPIVMVGASENYEARCRRHHIIRDRDTQQGKIYFLYGTDINVGKAEVEEYIKSKYDNIRCTSIKLFEEGENDILKFRQLVNKLSCENDLLFIRIVKSPLMPIQGDYTIIDFMSEYRKNSEIILISRNRKGLINEVLISFETIRKADLNINNLYYTKNSKNENEESIEVLEKIDEILKIKAIKI